MKYIKISILFLILLLGVSATLLADDLGAAMKKAKKEDKPLILYFFTNYCPYCLAMDQDVLADRDIRTFLKNKAVYLRINADKRNDLTKFYSVLGYPTTSFLEPSGHRIIQIPGYIEKQDFRKVLAYATGKHYKTIGLMDFLKK